MASMEPAEREAVAGLAEDVGQALLRCAQRLRDASATSVADTPTESQPAQRGRRPEGQPRGKRQQAVLELKGLTRGMTAAEVAKAVELKLPNAYKTLASMVDGGWLEVVPREEPTRWRKVRK